TGQAGGSKLLRRCWHGLYGIYFVMLLIAIVVLTTIILLVIPGLQRRRRVARFAARAVFRLSATPVLVSGRPLPSDPAIVVANHASYLDGIVMFAVLPVDYCFVIKREMQAVPVASLLLRRLGMEFVERSDSRRAASDTRRLMRAAKGGQHLAAFPEGTFRREPGLGRFHGGAFRAAVTAGLAVIPVTIRGTRAILADGQYLPVPGRIEIEVHEAIAVDRDGGRAEVARLRELAREAILATLGEPDLVAG
ncbi:MAG: 1-acyl-sn-glycerol-3-phosphate acyltransferase, partial [Gammaproteobacteria bacterium]|nr:1-acyl-sn-glycerol-3-phosphate acyltransferase [Gammaproteobacteria bacterium]